MKKFSHVFPGVGRSSALRIAVIALIMALPLVVPGVSLTRHVDNQLSEFRFAAAPRLATGGFVYAAIDQKSLQAVGTWPWPRDVHAQLVDRLIAAGARDVFLDIDFSTPSSPSGDARLARALEEAGGGVILPLFRQNLGAAASDPLIVTAPIPQLAEHAWPALVDVTVDDDGLVRSFPVTEAVAGVPTQSAAAVLSGFADPDVSRLAIDYSIRPETVPAYSVSDILSGKVAEAELKDRAVVVGAHATELKDLFTVPVYGILSGPMLHVLAAETLAQGRILKTLRIEPIAFLFAALVVTYSLFLRHRSLMLPLASAFALISTTEMVAFLLFKQMALVIPTATLWAILVAGLIMLLTERMGLSSWIAELVTAENRDIRRILKRVISDSVDPVIILDENLKLLDASETMVTMLALPGAVSRGTSLEAFAPSGMVAAVRDLQARHKQDASRVRSDCVEFSQQTMEGSRQLELAITISSLETRLGGETSPAGSHVVCLTLRDVTARRVYEMRLKEMARVDELTGALTRRGLVETIEESPGDWYYLTVDLHRFSQLNATLGREKGDMVLKAVAARIREHAVPNGVVARIDGDVLCCALPATAGPAGLAEQAERLMALFNWPFEAGGIKVELDARAGICLGSSSLGPASRWIEAAEMALDDAKRVVGRGWRAYDPATALRHARSRMIEAEMKTALEQGQFFLLFQPQVDLSSGQLTGVEALMRWQHPGLGMISPLEFVNIAEANGFICDLGRFLFEEACKAAMAWPSHVSVAVNVSPVQFARGTVLDDVVRALETSGLSPERLHLEITESTMLDRSEALLATLHALRSLGVSLALDDFGTGYSSLSYVSGLPLDKLKIDQAFVRNLVNDPAMQSIVIAVTSLAHGLGLKVVCEGIETVEQSRMLLDFGCEQGQGYFFGRPATAQRILEMATTSVARSFGNRVNG